MRRFLVGASVAVPLLFCGVAFSGLAAAQSRPVGGDRPVLVAPSAVPLGISATPSMYATERFLFVIRGEVLYQFDLQSLQLLHTFTFVPGPAPVPRPGTARRVVDVSTAEEPPPPPPVAPAPDAAQLGQSIKSALDWLVAHQDEDGHWDADSFMKHDHQGAPSDGPGNAVHDVGITGLAILAMLGNGSTLRSGPYKESLKTATEWLRGQQQENGLFGFNASHDFIYDHAIAAYAMCEAYGLSKYALLKPVAQKGINYLESHRNPYSVWRYQPRDNDNDTSVTTWAVAACASGKFFGLVVNEQALQTAGVWYDQITGEDGRSGYTKAGEPSSRKPGDHAVRFPVDHGEAMTAAAMYGRLLLGQDAQSKPILAKSADRLLACLPAWEKDRIDAVYWYYGTYAMYQMGGKYWDGWRGAITTLLDHQRADGNFAGSWDPVGVWDEDGGRPFVTALYALSLEAMHRYTKLVR
jgi:hypothetical protein